MKRHHLLATLLLLSATPALRANDAVYYAQGSQLVPIAETDIGIDSEVLTISLADDGFATVTVDYKLHNYGPAKTIDMGFEAARPYNTGDEIDPAGRHPYIEDFTVTMNGTPLTYRNAVVQANHLDTPFTPPTDGTLMEDAQYAYAYYFKAPFREGVNSVHHTYRYRMSYGVGRAFIVPYWLKPAARWRGGTIGDFTLRIRADHTAKHFCLPDSLFAGAEFVVTQGAGKVRHTKYEYSPDVVEIALRNATVQWHATNFRPTANMEITSADAYTFFDEDCPVGSFYDRGQCYILAQPEKTVDPRIARNLPYANRGYVFKDKKLQRYFSQLWWYMPDPAWKPSTDDFTPREWKLINEAN